MGPNLVQKEFVRTPAKPVRYYAKVAGSRFVCEDGTEYLFIAGFKDIAIKEHQNELNAILGRNPNIYIPTALPQSQDEAAQAARQNALSEVELAQAETNLRNSGVSVRVQTDVANPGRTNFQGVFSGEGHEVDLEIQRAMQEQQVATVQPVTQPNEAARVIGPGTSARIEELKRQAAERQAANEIKTQ